MPSAPVLALNSLGPSMSRPRFQFPFIVAAILLARSVVFGQELPPKAGRYYCYTTVYSPSPYQSGAIRVVPAFFGDVILDGKGNYKFSRKSGTGQYAFDRATSKLSFTGDLGLMTVDQYKSKNYSFFLTHNGLAFQCGLQDDTKPAAASEARPADAVAPVTATPAAKPVASLNEGLTGKILTTVSHRFNSFLGKVFEFDLAKGSYGALFPDGVASQNPKGEIFHFDKTSRLKITDRTGNQTLQVIDDKVAYNFDDYYPAISHSGEHIAYTAGHFAPADPKSEHVKIVIRKRDGSPVAEFPGYTQAAWTPDGRVVAAGAGRSKQGLYLIDAKFKSATRLADGFDDASMPSVSPDGKTVAFVKTGEVWTVKLDGTNPVKILFGSESAFPAWSPDGKFIATSTLFANHGIKSWILVIVNLKADTALLVKDGAGANVEARNRITWLP